MSWKDFAEELVGTSKEAVKKLAEYTEDYRIYPRSIIKEGKSVYFLAKIDQKKKLVILNKSENFELFQGKIDEMAGFKAKISPLNHYNADILRSVFPFTAPSKVGNKMPGIGLGDRLGNAAPGYIRALKEINAVPVLAQQSIRELKLSGHTLESQLDDLSWYVFQEGYQAGFAADADLLTKKIDIEKALEIGYSIITLDCKDYIINTAQMSETEIDKAYQEVPDYFKKGVEAQYLNKTFVLNSGYHLEYNQYNFKKIILGYYQMLDFLKESQHLIKKSERNIDLEVAVNKSLISTSPEAHFFIANELKRNKIELSSFAPSFKEEFWDGIEYAGDLDKFENEFKIHADIAEHFGYKLSIHSAANKYSILPIIGHYNQGRVQVKTSSISWLEALKIVAENDPSLYRDIHSYSLKKFEKEKEFNNLSIDLSQLPELAKLSDQELGDLLKIKEIRQLFNLTYKFILQDKKNGRFIFRDKLYKSLENYDKEYKKALENETAKHLNKLGFYTN